MIDGPSMQMREKGDLCFCLWLKVRGRKGEDEDFWGSVGKDDGDNVDATKKKWYL